MLEALRGGESHLLGDEHREHACEAQVVASVEAVPHLGQAQGEGEGLGSMVVASVEAVPTRDGSRPGDGWGEGEGEGEGERRPCHTAETANVASWRAGREAPRGS